MNKVYNVVESDDKEDESSRVSLEENMLQASVVYRVIKLFNIVLQPTQ